MNRNYQNNLLIRKIVLVIIILIGMIVFLSNSKSVHAIGEWEGEYFTYGSGLSKAQLEETEKLLDIVSRDIEKIQVNSQDYNKYTGLNTKDSSLYSSTVIVKTDKGSGLNVYINTPDNITQIEDHQYLNAALTSGLTDADIIIGSPVKVTGESALVGIYKALDVAGVEVNEEAVKVANEELSIVNEISQNNINDKSFDSKELTLALAEIKEKIANVADKDSLTSEDIANIVDFALKARGLNLSDYQKQIIVDWAEKFKELDIDWNAIGTELKNIGSKVSEKTKEFYHWGKESGFFSKIWEAITSFFSAVFSFFKDLSL